MITVLAALAAAATIRNPGFFSHDELAYLGKPFVWGGDPLSGSGFFRPMGAWLISVAMNQTSSVAVAHLLSVLLHALNAVLLWRCAAACGHAMPVAAAMLFAVSPLAAYSVGWTAALFDLGWTSCALVLWRLALSRTLTARPLLQGSLIAFAQASALMFKETALILPALLLFWAMTTGQTRSRLPHVVVTSLVCALYLGVRAASLDGLARHGQGGYGLAGLTEMAHNAVAYWIFPVGMRLTEVQQVWPMLSPGGMLALSGVHFVVVTVLTGARPIRLLLYCLAYFLPLTPVLVIQKHETQYLYASAATASLVLTFWCRSQRRRTILCVVGLLALLHTTTIHRFFAKDGACQAAFLDTVRTIDWDGISGPQLQVVIERGARWWVIHRALVHTPQLVERGITMNPISADASPDTPWRVDASCRLRGPHSEPGSLPP